MAHKKAGATAKTNRDSISKRLGIKIYGGQKVFKGNIIVRQKGNKFYAGENTKAGNDYTIFAMEDGVVKFKDKLGKKIVSVTN
ncbi:50S ribosomal protein L27 [Candidatus Daviesbacteria bacterium]|nr:50S ribosomal protein L27 [Candidatus Daviesbacteria bacterium]